MKTFKKIEETINNSSKKNILENRKTVLQPLIDFIYKKADKKTAIRINFICTHNSRRSHLSQIWAQTMAHYFSINNVLCYSGGTEATAMFPMVVKTLQKSGFQIEKLSENQNPVYSIKYNENEPAIIGFSKTLHSNFNPKTDFAAVMTCSQADEGCPFISGAEKRIPITYDDPKIFDNTAQQAEKYQERSEQIASEMFYIFSQVKNLLNQ